MLIDIDIYDHFPIELTCASSFFNYYSISLFIFSFYSLDEAQSAINFVNSIINKYYTLLSFLKFDFSIFASLVFL